MLRLSALDGTPLAHPADDTTTRVRSTLFALHEGLFANWWLRWLYFISGLLGCAVIGTGLVLWTVKRRQQHRTRSADAGSFTTRANALGLRLVEGPNAGTLVGLPIGLAAYFWANRLLPLALHERAEWEVHSLFLVWDWALLYACRRPVAGHDGRRHLRRCGKTRYKTLRNPHDPALCMAPGRLAQSLQIGPSNQGFSEDSRARPRGLRAAEPRFRICASPCMLASSAGRRARRSIHSDKKTWRFTP
ncbi:MAG: PepSY domain-containing protein [Achromobacter veterisilvae]